MSLDIETLMLKGWRQEELRDEIDRVISVHMAQTPKLMDIFVTLALGTGSVLDLSTKYDLNEEEVRNAYKRAKTILRHEHGSLRQFLDVL